MTIDLIAITLAILLFLRGYSRGIIVAICSVLAVLLGITCALSLSAKLSNFLLEKDWVSSALAPIVSYAILFFAVLWLVRLLAKLIEGFTSSILLGWVNKSIGGILYIALGMVLYSSVLWLCDGAHLLSPETKVKSQSYSYIAPLAPWVFAHIGEVIPFAKDTFSDMRHFFEGINHQLPEHVGTPR
jgi:membrane protein required for colicin V production